MTHPFHPLHGREFDLADYRRCWTEDRVFYVNEAGQLCALLARWTSVVAADPFVVVSDGRAYVRVQDLLEMVRLLRAWSA